MSTDEAKRLGERIKELAALDAHPDIDRLVAMAQVALPENETEAMHDAVMDLLYKGVARTQTNELWKAYRSALSANPQQPQPAEHTMPTSLDKTQPLVPNLRTLANNPQVAINAFGVEWAGWCAQGALEALVALQPAEQAPDVSAAMEPVAWFYNINEGVALEPRWIHVFHDDVPDGFTRYALTNDQT